MITWKVKLLSILAVIGLVSIVWLQYKLNKQLSEDLDLAKSELRDLKQRIDDSVNAQTQITSQLNDLQKTQYESQQTLRKKLATIKSKPIEEQKIELGGERDNILNCIEMISLGNVNCDTGATNGK